jgi:hypothetical protein
MADPALPLFYKRPRPLRSKRDADISLAMDKSFGFAAATNSTPLTAPEMPIACKFFPILFSDSAVPLPVALLGLRASENLYVDDAGNWAEGVYIPGYVRRYPFIFVESEDKSELTLCVDESADSIIEGRSNPFFDDLGPTDVTSTALAFCREYQAQHTATVEFTKALKQADLLIENRADVALKGGAKLTLAGFKVIDEGRFNKLPDEEFLRWRERGWLHLIYCHFVSVGNWSNLLDRLATRMKAA